VLYDFDRHELIESLSAPDTTTMIAEMTCSRGHHWFEVAAVYEPETGHAVFGSGVDYCMACEEDVLNAPFCWIGDEPDPFASQVYWGRVYLAEEIAVQTTPPEWLQDKWREASSRRIEFHTSPNKALIAWAKTGEEGSPVIWSRSWKWSRDRKKKKK
jgi:hypothetical protein